jgi:hypothetical protein
MTNWVRLGHKGAIANQLENVAYVLIAGEAYEPAVRLLAAADVIREAADARMAFDEEPEYNAAKDRLRDAMTASAFAAGWAEGQAMSQPDAVAVALTA